MKLENMRFEGKLNEILKISKDLKSLPDNFVNKDVNIVCAENYKKVFISPINSETDFKITPCKELENLKVFLPENKIKFDYNERKYFVYGAPKQLTSGDLKDLVE